RRRQSFPLLVARISVAGCEAAHGHWALLCSPVRRGASHAAGDCGPPANRHAASAGRVAEIGALPRRGSCGYPRGSYGSGRLSLLSRTSRYLPFSELQRKLLKNNENSHGSKAPCKITSHDCCQIRAANAISVLAFGIVGRCWCDRASACDVA